MPLSSPLQRAPLPTVAVSLTGNTLTLFYAQGYIHISQFRDSRIHLHIEWFKVVIIIQLTK
jgi:hypothetical protein